MGNRDIKYMRLDDIKPAPRNPKNHDEDAIGTSIDRFGLAELPLLDERTGRLVAGHGRWHDLLQRAERGDEPPDGVRVDRDGQWLMPVVRGWRSRSDAEAEAYLVASNRLTMLGGWGPDLADVLASIGDADPDLLLAAGYNDDDLADLLGGAVTELPPALTDPDEVPDPPTEPVSTLGDLWLLGPHRLLCGDSTSAQDVRRVVGEESVTLVHADPPYGMGKESDGVLNDNLYGPRLDEFQMGWWVAWRGVLTDNATAYIWGNAPDLWRLWWTGGLGADDDLMVRNEIVWDKGTSPGMRSAGEHSYPCATERCLFLMRGEQFLGNLNKADFWEGYEPLRAWLVAERDRVGWSNKDVNALTDTQMAGHWFTRSQFMPISARHYRVLQEAAGGRAFVKSHDDLFSEMFPDVRSGGNAHHRDLYAKLREERSYFNNTHDAMTDVWQFPRVVGAERQGHATPKPVALVERAMLSSSREGDLVGVPFGGSGPEFIAAHRLRRRAAGVELEPRWVDVICRRFQEHTGIKPILAATGQPHDFVGGE